MDITKQNKRQRKQTVTAELCYLILRRREIWAEIKSGSDWMDETLAMVEGEIEKFSAEASELGCLDQPVARAQRKI